MFRPFGWNRRRLSEYDEALLADRTAVGHGGFTRSDAEEQRPAGADPTTTCCQISGIWALSAYLTLLSIYFAALFVPWESMFYGVYEYDEMELPVKITLHALMLPPATCLGGMLLLKHEQHSCMEYLQFYKDVRRLVYFPQLFASMSNAAILLCTQWPIHGYLSTSWGRTHVLELIVGLELVCMVTFCIIYMRHVSNLYRNNAAIHPDLLPIGSLLPPSYLVEHGEAHSTCERPRPLEGLGAITPEVGEVLLYLTQHVIWLGRDVMQLEKKLAIRTQRPSQDPRRQVLQADVQNMLEARDQQIRSLMAEQQGLQKQQSVAWKLVEEKDAENQRLSMNRQQHIDENYRLRATLREWSQRNAKLEQQLNRLAAELESMDKGPRHGGQAETSSKAE